MKSSISKYQKLCNNNQAYAVSPTLTPHGVHTKRRRRSPRVKAGINDPPPRSIATQTTRPLCEEIDEDNTVRAVALAAGSLLTAVTPH